MKKHTKLDTFSKPFNSSSDIKKELENLYSPMLQMMLGISSSQTKDTFYDLFNQAKADANASIELPANFGDILLEKESTNVKIKSILAKKRIEGVRDEDIRWWWNMHEIERKMMLKVDELYRGINFIKHREDGYSQEAATKIVKKFCPDYGDPNDTSNSTDDDKPLPFELKDRINIYVENYSKLNPERFKREIENSSSFNALIRGEIKKGNV